jgi:RNA polymerase sigma-70 factor (ECF subfamily)
MTAEDITEEVFLKAWKAIKSCKGRGKTFSSWLYRIAHNHMVNTLRDNNRITYLANDREIQITDPTRQAELNIECQEMLKAIDCLPENQKQVIILKFIEGLDNREISKIIGKSEGAVRITQMRALTKLREKFGEER